MHTINHQMPTLGFVFLMVYNPLLFFIRLRITLSYIWLAGCCVITLSPKGLLSPSCGAVTPSVCVPFKPPQSKFLFLLLGFSIRLSLKLFPKEGEPTQTYLNDVLIDRQELNILYSHVYLFHFHLHKRESSSSLLLSRMYSFTGWTVNF